MNTGAASSTSRRSQLDKQRIEAVRMLEGLGYAYQDGEWLPTVVAPPLPVTAEADAMHGALMRRADALAGCTKGSDEEGELETIVDLLEAYEVKRWPLGKDLNVPRGKG
jgi:hypothetical protein